MRRYCTVYCSVDIYCNKCNPPLPNKTRCPIAISHRLIDISRVCIVQHIETTRFYTREEVVTLATAIVCLATVDRMSFLHLVSEFEVFNHIIRWQILDTGLPILPLTYMILRPGLGGATLRSGAAGNLAIIGQTTN